MTDTNYRFVLQATSPRGKGFEIGDNSVEGTQVDIAQVANKLQRTQLAQGFYTANAALFSSKGESGVMPVIAEGGHIEILFRWSAAK